MAQAYAPPGVPPRRPPPRPVRKDASGKFIPVRPPGPPPALATAATSSSSSSSSSSATSPVHTTPARPPPTPPPRPVPNGAVAARPPAQLPSRPPNLTSSTSANSDTGSTDEPEDKALKQKRIRTKVVKEIVSTEATYVERLQTLVEVYIRPLTELSTKADSPPRVLNMEDINKLFSNIELICQLNAKFLQDLEERIASWTEDSEIGNLFVEFAPYFKMYISYVNNHDTANKYLNDLLKSHELFQQFESTARQHPKVKGNALSSFLIEPIQRIPRYKLLIQELIKRTPEDHPDLESLKKALETVAGVATNINEAVRNAQARAKILEISSSFSKNPGIVAAARVFKSQGPLMKCCRREDKKFEFFLFNDLLMYASRATPVSKWNLHRKLPINSSFFVQDIPDSQGGRNYRFQIVTSQKSFMVYAASRTEKEKWLTELQECIEEHKIRIHTDDKKVNFTAPVWQQDHENSGCRVCKDQFTFFNRRHHCRKCGDLVCNTCSASRMVLPGTTKKERVCKKCVQEIREAQGKKVQGMLAPLPSVPQQPATLSEAKDQARKLLPPPSGGSKQGMRERAPSDMRDRLNRVSVSLHDNPLYGTESQDDGKELQGKTFLAQYSYKARSNAELSFNAGASVELLHKEDDAWYYACCNGVEGLVPASYVKEVPPDFVPEKLEVTALYEATSPDELTIAQGDIVLVKARDGAWGLVEKVGSIFGAVMLSSGWIPVNNYTKPYTPPKKAHRRVKSTIPTTTPTEPIVDDDDDDFTALVLYNYVPEVGSSKEMDLVKGQIIILLRFDNEDWWKGYSPTTGQRGWFPAKYVQMITGAGVPQVPRHATTTSGMSAHSSSSSSSTPLKQPHHAHSASQPVASVQTAPVVVAGGRGRRGAQLDPSTSTQEHSGSAGCDTCHCSAFRPNQFKQGVCLCQHGKDHHHVI